MALKAVYGHSDSDSSTDERRKALHIMYRGSWEYYILARRQDFAPSGGSGRSFS
jgi:hypothetical protein